MIDSNALRLWWLSLRPYSFTASMMPVALAGAITVSQSLLSEGAEHTALWTVPFFALSAILLHSGTNVLNDYYDHLHDVDGPGDTDPTHTISRGIVTPRFMHVSGIAYFIMGIAAGLPIGIVRGGTFVSAGLVGALGAFIYTGKRVSLKYVALGDALVFLLLGPALVFMGVWAFLGERSLAAVFLSLPLAFLVTAILHGNNLRDIRRDRASGIRTLAGLIGVAPSRVLFVLLLAGAYLVTIATAVSRGIALLLPVVTIPVAINLARFVLTARDPAQLVDLPRRCAALHLVFSVSFVAAVAVAPLVPGVVV